MNNIKNFSLSFMTVLLLTACAGQGNNELQIKQSFLKKKGLTTEVANAELVANSNPAEEVPQQEFRFVPPIKLNTNQAKSAQEVLTQFSATKELTITANELPLKDYLHQVFGEQLQLSYILAEEVKSDNQSVSLNLQTPITERKLFTLTEEILTQRNYTVRFDDGIFYIHKATQKAAKGNVVYGYGKQLSDVPQTSLDIIQMVPFEYGAQTSLGNTLRQLLGVKALTDQQRSSITVQGKRKDVIRALELIQIMDQPLFKDRQIGVYKSAFLSTKELTGKLTELLGQEGISVGKGKAATLALSIVELDKQGELIFFANNIDVIERAVFWAKTIDKPLLSSEKKYFIYSPMYSRAIDMGESLEALIGSGGSGLGNSTSAAEQNKGASQSQVRSASSKDMKMVIDERANSLIFFTSGEAYQQLYPLIKRLDVLPKQVMLEVVIAEVKLTDEFKSGVDFNLTNQGSATTAGGFNLEGSDTGLSYVLSGTRGKLSVSLFQKNDNVNVLSRPTLLVRDGVMATITVGDDIPTVGAIVTDPVNGSTTSVVYRKTGVDLKVQPTINARGVIIMEINQKISNQATGSSSVENSPIIFERTIETEVIAESGQTIVLGGLMSENRTINDTSVPFFSDLPFVGKLFDSKNDTKDKTELVVLVTPRIIESSDEWEDIKARFSGIMADLLLE
ncbi:type II secretion system protein GspD [Thalassomonas haliotis]|uniref:General secretion pathway protein GspD n=1 Tax=Thalassomonas haliotis TaxID=485448 RepID=A0ABY7VKS6_9GAMM|nr:secretin N-terminal domain-containing protein [Thalassomonas haliotis]WDE13272.1 general secretion pathway protein GspD [Thalassomonas haliotis]